MLVLIRIHFSWETENKMAMVFVFSPVNIDDTGHLIIGVSQSITDLVSNSVMVQCLAWSKVVAL